MTYESKSAIFRARVSNSLIHCTKGNSYSDRNNKTFPMMTIKASIIIGKARNKIPSTSLGKI